MFYAYDLSRACNNNDGNVGTLIIQRHNLFYLKIFTLIWVHRVGSNRNT